GPAPGRPLTVLVLATRFKLAYRVLRCAAAAGAHVLVLGEPRARGLASSRFCAAFEPTLSRLDGGFEPALATEIDRHCAERGVDWVIAGAAPATRSLTAVRHPRRTPCFPMPELETFALLNDKWRFADLCAELGVAHPPTRLFASPGALSDHYARADHGGR